MDDGFRVVLLSLIMFVGSYLSGYSPLFIGFSELKVKRMTLFGAGLLVGTALAVIIPEGINMVVRNAVSHKRPESPKLADGDSVAGGNAKPELVGDSAHEHHDDHDVELGAIIGFPLVLGFVFMLFVDQIGTSYEPHSHSHAAPAVADTVGLVADKSVSINVVPTDRRAPTSSGSSFVTTLGLVVHAAADGIALGAASTTSQLKVEMVVFAAIMLHKAPAAFGLVSFLLHENTERWRIRKYLLVFSAAAPVFSVLTFVLLSMFASSATSDGYATSATMLFSAGTFLYVATVHVLPEVCSAYTGGDAAAGGASQPGAAHKTALGRTDTGLMAAGAFLPLVLSLVGHHH